MSYDMFVPVFLTTSSPDLRDARDAHVVFEAVRLGVLPLITRRLTAGEREQLASGNVFVWEEAEHKQGELTPRGYVSALTTHASFSVLSSRWAGTMDGRETLVNIIRFSQHLYL